MEEAYNDQNSNKTPKNDDSLQNKSKIKYIIENFEKIKKDAPLINLNFKSSFSISQKILNYLSIFDKYQGIIKVKHALLRQAYEYDKTNVKILEDLQEIFNKKLENKEEFENFSYETGDIIRINKPLLTYDYLSEIFGLINLFLEYDSNNIYKMYDIFKCIMKISDLQKIADNFNIEISISNKKAYFFSIYYAWLKLLVKKMEKLKDDNLEKTDFYFNNFLKTEDNLKKEIELLSIKLKAEIGEDEKKDIKFKDLQELIDKRINIEIANHYKKTNEIISSNDKIEKIRNLESNLEDYIKCRDSLEMFCYNKFFKIYLDNLQNFLFKIPNTLKYLNGLEYDNESNIKILTNFIFFISHFDFNKKKGIEYVQYYETTFDKFELDKSFKYLKIIDNKLVNIKEQKEIANFENYNLNCYKLEEMNKNRYLNEGYIKFNLLHEKNIFTKYQNIYLTFFKELFLKKNSCVRKLFITTFPVLEDNYFINSNFLNYIFKEKIYAFNFKYEEFVGLTDNTNLNIYIKDNYFYEVKDEIEVEICIFAAFIIILLHELAHYIRIYIFRHLGAQEYEDSFDFEVNEEAEIGRFIEKKLFGKVIEKLKINEALFILNIDNYFTESIDDFLNNFNNLKKIKSITNISNKTKEFLESVDINISKELKLNEKSELTIKSSHDHLYIGVNNDKGESQKAIKEAYSNILEKFKK